MAYFYSVLKNEEIEVSYPIGTTVGGNSDYSACVAYMVNLIKAWGVEGVDKHPYYVFKSAKLIYERAGKIEAISLLIHAFPGLGIGKAEFALREFIQYRLEVTGEFIPAEFIHSIEAKCSGASPTEYADAIRAEWRFLDDDMKALRQYASAFSNRIGDNMLIAISDLL